MSIEAPGSPLPPLPPVPPYAPAPVVPPQRQVVPDPDRPDGETPAPAPAANPVRTAVAVTCLVLGIGLIGGAAAGSWLLDGGDRRPAAVDDLATARGLWHSTPVDTLFPRVIHGPGAGPGGADRTWTRLGVAPDGPCATALDPPLTAELRPVGCERVVRATYTDATASDVVTVGLVFTRGDRTAMKALRARFGARRTEEQPSLLPRSFAVAGTAAGAFGDRQRASWSVDVLTDVPAVVFSVSGFADGRTITTPEPADRAMETGATGPAAQAGLGHDAKGVADRVERALRGVAEAAVPVTR